MDQEKISIFIQQLRKEQAKTQKELADELGISDKTVSKWETGKGMPDIAMMLPLCNALGISVNELLFGERLSTTDYSEKAEENMINLLKENEDYKKGSILQTCIGVVLGILALAFMYFTSGRTNLAWYIDFPTLIRLALICGACVFASGARGKKSIVAVIHKSVIPAGAFIALVDCVFQLGRLDDPAKLGPIVCVTVLGLVYSVLCYLIFIPINYRMERK